MSCWFLLAPVLIDADNFGDQASCNGMFRCHDLQYVLFKTWEVFADIGGQSLALCIVIRTTEIY